MVLSAGSRAVATALIANGDGGGAGGAGGAGGGGGYDIAPSSGPERDVELSLIHI